MIWTDEEIVEWHKKTFPDCTAQEQADKVGEEIHELIMAFVNEEKKERIAEEVADVYIASLVLEKRFGIKTSLFLSRLGKEDSIKKKMDENAKRTWVKVNGVYRHKD